MRRSVQLKAVSLVGAAALSGICLARPATAAEIIAERFPGDPYALVLIEGPIEDGDDQRFAQAVEPFLGAPAMVVLRSPGGSVPAALGIGQQIRRAYFATNVLEDHACQGACALIWLAGIQRHLTQASTIDLAGLDGWGATEPTPAFRSWEATLGTYLSELGLPEPAVRYVTEAEAGDARPITPEIAGALGIPVWELRDGQVIPPGDEPTQRSW